MEDDTYGNAYGGSKQEQRVNSELQARWPDEVVKDRLQAREPESQRELGKASGQVAR